MLKVSTHHNYTNDVGGIIYFGDKIEPAPNTTITVFKQNSDELQHLVKAAVCIHCGSNSSSKCRIYHNFQDFE